jgi:hypothetical protein
VINVTGNVYRLANPTLNTPTVNLAARVGDASPSANISVTNSSPDIFTEGLNVMRGATAAGFTSSGSITNLVAQGTSTNAIQVALNTGTAGTFSGTQALNFISTGTGTTGAPDISVGSGGVALNGKVYTPAVAQVANTTVDFGIVHVGDAVGAKALTVTNIAPVTPLNDVLRGSLGPASGPFTTSGNLGAGLGPGASDSTRLTAALNTASAGVFSSSAILSSQSYNADMLDLALTDINILLNAQVNNFADAIFEKVSGIGIFTQVSLNEFSLDFGQLSIGSGLFEAQLGVRNDASAPADTLGGGFDLNAPNFILSGFSAFDGIEAGNLLSGLEVGFNANALGDYNGLILLHPFGYNSSGFNGTLPDIALNLQAEVVSGQPVPEPSTWILLVTGLGTLGWIRRMRKMSRGE